MRWSALVIGSCLTLAVACSTPRATDRIVSARDLAGNEPADVVREHLRAMYNWKLFSSREAAVVGISGGEGAARIWYRNAATVLREQETYPPPPHRVHTLQTHRLDDALAAVTARYSTADRRVDCRAVYTLSRESGLWQIVAWVFETRLAGQP